MKQRKNYGVIEDLKDPIKLSGRETKRHEVGERGKIQTKIASGAVKICPYLTKRGFPFAPVNEKIRISIVYRVRMET